MTTDSLSTRQDAGDPSGPVPDQSPGTPGDSAASKVPDQREHRRYPISEEFQVSWLAPDGRPSEPIRLHATDISRGGLRLVGRSMVVPGTRGVVLLTLGTKGAGLRGIEVVFQRMVEGFVHEIGVKFIPLPPNTGLRHEETGHGPRLIKPRG